MSANMNANIWNLPQQNLNDILMGLLNRSFTKGGVVVATTPGTATNLFDLTTTTHFCINGKSYSVASGTNKTVKSKSVKNNKLRVVAGGTGYNFGDILNLTTTGTGAKAMVVSLTGGVVNDVRLVEAGYDYVVGTSATTVSSSPVGGASSGTGCTIDIMEVEPLITQAVSTYCNYLISVTSGGVFLMTAGPVGTVALSEEFGDLPLGSAPIGYINIATSAAGTFILNTTATNAAQVTALYKDLSSVVTSVPQNQ